MSTVAKRDHGSLAVRASLVGQMSYYWGGAWYSEKCPDVDFGRWSVSGEMYAFRSYSPECIRHTSKDGRDALRPRSFTADAG
jgi:hypothetical protein